jgi:hypothetical protein
MQTQEVVNTVSTDFNVLQANNPFKVIPVPENHRVKIWDFDLECVDSFDKLSVGRVRILAVVPKKPLPLENIKFSVAWCAPGDVKHFNKDKSNKILIGRYLANFVENRSVDSCGVVGKIDSLAKFQMHVFNEIETPRWVKNVERLVQRTSTFGMFFDTADNKFYMYEEQD